MPVVRPFEESQGFVSLLDDCRSTLYGETDGFWWPRIISAESFDDKAVSILTGSIVW